MKKYKYIFNNKEINLTSSGGLKLSNLIKRSLTKNGYDMNNFIDENSKNLEKCRICKTHYPPMFIECHEEDGMIVVDGFTPLKDKVYCYGLNKECPGIKMNSNSVEFISKTLLLSNEDALKYIKSNNKSSFYKENWDNLDDYKKSQSRDSNYFRNKYGDNWEIEYDKYKRSISYSNSLEGYINKYGEIEGERLFKFVSSKKDSMSFNYYLKKNNNDLIKAEYEYNDRLKQVSQSLKACILRYGEEVGVEKHIQRINKNSISTKNYWSKLTKEEKRLKHSMSLEACKERYGCEKIANLIYNKWLDKIILPIARASKESLQVFLKLNNLLDEYGIEYNDVYIGYEDRNEYYIKDGLNIYFYDFVIRSKKIIIEYNGIAFHPKLENIDFFKPILTKLSPIELYNKQKYKVELAEKNGFKVLEIWSDDVDNVSKCIEFIKNDIK
jgi:hypothetical protein